MDKDKPVYLISAVAKMFDVHAQTLRLYEREGLLNPSRTQGNTRLYSERDVERLEQILSLSRDMGVNLAGIEIILRLQERQKEFEIDVTDLLQDLRETLGNKEPHSDVETCLKTFCERQPHLKLASDTDYDTHQNPPSN